MKFILGKVIISVIIATLKFHFSFTYLNVSTFNYSFIVAIELMAILTPFLIFFFLFCSKL